MKRINFKSDFDFILRIRDCAGKDAEWPDYDWTALFWTSDRERGFTASCIGGVTENCYNDDGKIHIVADNHHLSPGTLKVEFTALLPDGNFGDGSHRLVRTEDLDIRLVRDDEDITHNIEIETLLPYIKGDRGEKGERGEHGDKGDAFTYADFTADQIAALQKPAAVAAANLAEKEKTFDQAEKARESATQTAVNNANSAATYTREVGEGYADAVEAAKVKFFDDLWEAACQSFGKVDYSHTEEDGSVRPYYLNGLWLTYAEAVKIYRCYSKTQNHTRRAYAVNVKTLIPVEGSDYSIFAVDSSLEVVKLAPLYNAKFDKSFFRCKKLKSCQITSDTFSNIANTFFECTALEDLKISNLNLSLNLAYSPLLTAESLRYIFEKRYGTNTITVTVHPDVYAKLTSADTDTRVGGWDGLLELAAKKNITVASA